MSDPTLAQELLNEGIKRYESMQQNAVDPVNPQSESDVDRILAGIYNIGYTLPFTAPFAAAKSTSDTAKNYINNTKTRSDFDDYVNQVIDNGTFGSPNSPAEREALADSFREAITRQYNNNRNTGIDAQRANTLDLRNKADDTVFNALGMQKELDYKRKVGTDTTPLLYADSTLRNSKPINPLTNQEEPWIANPKNLSDLHKNMTNEINKYVNHVRAQMPVGISGKDLESITEKAKSDDDIYDYLAQKLRPANAKDNNSVAKQLAYRQEIKQSLEDFQRIYQTRHGYGVSTADAALAYLNQRHENNVGNADLPLGQSTSALERGLRSALVARQNYETLTDLANKINTYNTSYNNLATIQNNYINYSRYATDIQNRHSHKKTQFTEAAMNNIHKYMNKFNDDLQYSGGLYETASKNLADTLLRDNALRKSEQLRSETQSY